MRRRRAGASYPRHLRVNFRKMSIDTLRRYVNYIGLEMIPDATPQEYTNAIARHFDKSYSVNESKVLGVFGKYLNYSELDGIGRRGARGGARGNSNTADTADGDPPAKRRRRVKESPPVEDLVGTKVEVFWEEHQKWYVATVKEFDVTKRGFFTLVYASDGTEEYVKLEHGGIGKALGELGKAEEIKWRFFEEGEKTVEPQVTYKSMIKQALLHLGKQHPEKIPEGTFREICKVIQKRFWKQLNWKAQSGIRRTPVWKSSVRKILFSNSSFRRRQNSVFCLRED